MVVGPSFCRTAPTNTTDQLLLKTLVLLLLVLLLLSYDQYLLLPIFLFLNLLPISLVLLIVLEQFLLLPHANLQEIFQSTIVPS
jgi:hypothetical protein